MNKNCRKCNEKLTEGLNFKSWRIKNSDFICNECYNEHHAIIRNKPERKIYAKNYRESLNDALYSVYLLINEKYGGVTQSMYKRLQNHKNLGRDTEYRVLYQTKDRDEALELEALLHDEGYKGKHIQNRYA